MKVLMAASEAAPFIKSGGLGDVIASLPKALKKIEVDVRVIIPKYYDIDYKYKEKMKFKTKFNVSVGWRNQYCGIEEYELDGIVFYFVDNEYYFKRPGMYGFYDEAERYAFFCKSVLESLYYINFKPDIIHCHDWQTALIPILLEEKYRCFDMYKNIKTVFTIHNLKYQGIYGIEVLEELFDLSKEYAQNNAFEFYNDINLLKAALYYSNWVTTVSPSYAQEIQIEFYGEKLDGILREINYKLSGILNGIDYDIFNPNKDPYIFVNYLRSYKKKMQNKVKLQKMAGLPQNENIPILAVVSRLVEQKGLDLIAHVIDEILNIDAQFIVLGVGEKQYERLFYNLSSTYPDKIKAFIQFDVELAQKIYAGSDMFLMPSLFEPCGLSQIIALKYGTIPIVRSTGGLRDTIIPYNINIDEGTGFSFENYNAHELLYCIQKAVKMFHEEKDKWNRLVKNAFKVDFSWDKSALQYVEVYKKVII